MFLMSLRPRLDVYKRQLEMRRRVKEQLKKLGGMEFYDVNFSYIDLHTFEGKFVSVPEQGLSLIHIFSNT